MNAVTKKGALVLIAAALLFAAVLLITKPPAPPVAEKRTEPLPPETMKVTANTSKPAVEKPMMEGAFGWKLGETLPESKTKSFKYLNIFGLVGTAEPSTPHEFFSQYELAVTGRSRTIYQITAIGPALSAAANQSRAQMLIEVLKEKYGGEKVENSDSTSLKFPNARTIDIAYSSSRPSKMEVTYMDSSLFSLSAKEHTDLIKESAKEINKSGL